MVYTGLTITFKNSVSLRKYFIKKGFRKMEKKISLPENNDPEMISAKEIVKTYNLTYQTVNHYTDLGLLPVVAKRGNVRFYDNAVVKERIKHIRELVKEGYSLRLIRKKLVGI